MLSDRLTTDLADVQGLIVSGYGHLDHAAYWFLHFSDPAASNRWLFEMLRHITTADWKGPDGRVMKPSVAVNIAFTAHGLDTLGFPRESKQTFPGEFLAGMSVP